MLVTKEEWDSMSPGQRLMFLRRCYREPLRWETITDKKFDELDKETQLLILLTDW